MQTSDLGIWMPPCKNSCSTVADSVTVTNTVADDFYPAILLLLHAYVELINAIIILVTCHYYYYFMHKWNLSTTLISNIWRSMQLHKLHQIRARVHSSSGDNTLMHGFCCLYIHRTFLFGTARWAISFLFSSNDHHTLQWITSKASDYNRAYYSTAEDIRVMVKKAIAREHNFLFDQEACSTSASKRRRSWFEVHYSKLVNQI